MYEELLAAPGEAPPCDAHGNVVPTPSPKPRPDALQRLSIIKPSRTHKAGTDERGAVRDFISVWVRC
ncbi:hypothetical protein CDD83_788 [Cordyceps sp. RAO-2017]|nr:hypothetical protein CDD83_788 [Cordyceps sp. RAO-2017]